MKGFARVTKLGNIGGRADYISNPVRQEKIMAKSEAGDWKPYHEFEMANQKSATRNNEGREVIAMLPNEWSKLPEAELSRKAQKVAETIVGKSTDMQWAVQWNKRHSNLHIHVIFSERQKEKAPKRWDRNVYATKDGKVARSKADRAKDSEGNYIFLHRKGEEKGGFTTKDSRYSDRSWVKSMKIDLFNQLARLGADMERYDPLHQYHEGKGSDSKAIHDKNVLIKQNNEVIKKLSAELPDFPMERLKEIAICCLRENKIIQPEMIVGELEQYGYPPSALRPNPPQKRSEPILEPSRDERVRISINPPKTKSERILEAVKGMETSLSEYSAAMQNLHQCRFWEVGRKKEFRKKADEYRDKFKTHLETLKSNGVKTDIGFADVLCKPALLDYLKDQAGLSSKPKPQQKPQHRDSRQVTLDSVQKQIQQARERTSGSEPRTQTKKKDREISR